VSYRASARERALSLGLAGWVRNVVGGGVEILAEGDPAGISAFVDWCRHGPRWASVDGLDVLDEPAAGELADFSVRRDG